MGKEEDTKLRPGLDFDPLQDKTSVSAVASNDGVSGAACIRQARLLDEIVFKGNDYAGDRTVRAGIITLLSKKGLQVQIKVAVGQRPEQTFVKWSKVLELRKTH